MKEQRAGKEMCGEEGRVGKVGKEGLVGKERKPESRTGGQGLNSGAMMMITGK